MYIMLPLGALQLSRIKQKVLGESALSLRIFALNVSRLEQISQSIDTVALLHKCD